MLRCHPSLSLPVGAVLAGRPLCWARGRGGWSISQRWWGEGGPHRHSPSIARPILGTLRACQLWPLLAHPDTLPISQMGTLRPRDKSLIWEVKGSAILALMNNEHASGFYRERGVSTIAQNH